MNCGHVREPIQLSSLGRPNPTERCQMVHADGKWQLTRLVRQRHLKSASDRIFS